MSNVTIPIWFGTRASYNAISTKQTGIIYSVLETTGVYVQYYNEAPINKDIMYVSGLPPTEQGKTEMLYIDMTATPNAKIYYFDGLAYKVIGGDTIDPSVMEYKGAINATDPTENANWTNASTGNLFIVTTAGTIDGVVCKVGNTLIINKDVTGVPTAADFDLVAAPPVELINNLTTTNSGVGALDANQGRILDEKKINKVATTIVDNIVTFSTATGDVKDSGLSIATNITDSAVNTKVATEKAVADALVFGTF